MVNRRAFFGKAFTAIVAASLFPLDGLYPFQREAISKLYLDGGNDTYLLESSVTPATSGDYKVTTNDDVSILVLPPMVTRELKGGGRKIIGTWRRQGDWLVRID